MLHKIVMVNTRIYVNNNNILRVYKNERRNTQIKCLF